MARYLDEGVVGYGAGKPDVWLNAPVEFLREEGGVVEEETTQTFFC
jgi:hypothetical protein